MQRRISEALVTLNGMVSIDSFCSIEEDERIEYEKRVASLAKNWCFLSRLNWLPSPREIARYGWRLINPTTVECKTCHIKLCIKEEGICIDGDENSSVGHLLKEFMQFNDMEFDFKLKQIGTLRYSHKSFCSFALVEIPLQYENVYVTPEVIQSFSDLPASCPPAVYCFQQYLAILENNTTYSLPILSENTLQATDKALQRRAQMQNDDSNRTYDFRNNPNVIYALMGWKLEHLQRPGHHNHGNILNKRDHFESRFTLVCEWCHRTVGSWNFQVSGDDQQPTKKQKTSDGTASLPDFDALGQHLEFCPWARHIESEAAAWKQILDYYCIPIREDSALSLKAEEGYHKLLVALNGS